MERLKTGNWGLSISKVNIRIWQLIKSDQNNGRFAVPARRAVTGLW